MVPSLAWAFPVGLLVGAGSISFLTTSTAIVQVEAAPEMRGRVLALQAIVFLGSTPIGGPIVGCITDTFGPRGGVLVGGMAGVAAAAWGLWAYRRVRGTFAADVRGPSRSTSSSPTRAPDRRLRPRRTLRRHARRSPALPQAGGPARTSGRRGRLCLRPAGRLPA